jgi:hypothetical protein
MIDADLFKRAYFRGSPLSAGSGMEVFTGLIRTKEESSFHAGSLLPGIAAEADISPGR